MNECSIWNTGKLLALCRLLVCCCPALCTASPDKSSSHCRLTLTARKCRYHRYPVKHQKIWFRQVHIISLDVTGSHNSAPGHQAVNDMGFMIPAGYHPDGRYWMASWVPCSGFSPNVLWPQSHNSNAHFITAAILDNRWMPPGLHWQSCRIRTHYTTNNWISLKPMYCGATRLVSQDMT